MKFNKQVFLDGLTDQEKRIRRTLREVYDEIGSEAWGDGTPGDAEFVDVITDRAYDRLSPEDRDYLMAVNNGRLKRLALSIQ